jgi:thioredoxin reductase (NADPH)
MDPSMSSALPVPPDPAAGVILDETDLQTLRRFGRLRRAAVGEVLQREGQVPRDFYVVVSGAIEVLLRIDGTEQVVRRHGPGRFLGELSLLTGQRMYYSARVAEAGELIEVGHDAFRRLIATEPELSDTILKAFIARHSTLVSAPPSSLRILGSSFSPESLRLREFAARNGLIHQWIDVERLPEPEQLLRDLRVAPEDLPAVVAGDEVLRSATPGMLSSFLGLTLDAVPERRFDVVVVGAGPAGLAASVYAASEGLSTLTVEAIAIGGQAGTSSRIENYLGFPTGISGTDLANRAMLQAIKFGAQITSPCVATGLGEDTSYLVVHLSDGTEVGGRALIIATGARYRRLPVASLASYEGAGIYYSATETEALECTGSRVMVVGAGNSAGQAAMFLSERAGKVLLVARGNDLCRHMSSYLVDRIAAHPRIEVRLTTQVTALRGDGRLEGVTLTDANGSTADLACGALFSFIGADAGTDWLSPCASLTDTGFIRTDRALERQELGERWDVLGRDPLPFETAYPGLFAVGDVRSGSVKRVASAVGEGSAVMRSVHEHLSFRH